MTNKEFCAFVKRPRFIEDTDGIKIFEDPVRDEDHKTYYSTNLKIFVPIILFYIGLAFYFTEGYLTFLKEFILFFSFGLFAWTFLEYYEHRWVLHKEFTLNPEAESVPEELGSMFEHHLNHHVFMNQKYRIIQDYRDYP